MLTKTWLLLLLIITSTNLILYSVDLEQKKEFMINRHLKQRGISSPTVLNAMSKVAREEFVLRPYRSNAYDDRPLTIGHGQTISQPYIVAYMTELLNLKPESKVLEIGTGSGYQAAILAEITKYVYTVEIIEALHLRANRIFKKLGYNTIVTKWADGYYGLEEFAPYDAIIVTCAAKSVPPELIKQLKVGGKICIPVGLPFSVQVLYLITKHAEDDIRTEAINYVQFVPLIRANNK